MNIFHPFFAQQTLPLDVVSAPWKRMDLATRDILIILGAVAVVTLLVVTWALVFRKRKRGRSRHHSSHHTHTPAPQRPSGAEEAVNSEADPEPGRERRRRRHRRHREHRPRNPTLAETGGLPPLRSGPPQDPYP